VDALLDTVTLDDNKENAKTGDSTKSLKLGNGDAKKATVEDDNTMKEIEI